MTKYFRYLRVFILGLILFGPHAFADNIIFSLNTGISGQEVYLTGNLWRWDSKAVPMTEFSPGNYSTTIPQPWLHQLQYKFVVNNKWIFDPKNPKTIAGDEGFCNSLLEIPFHEDPLLTENEKTPLWLQTQLKLNMQLPDATNKEKVIEILYPENRDPQRELVTIYLQDGLEYLNQGSIKNLIANLSLDPSMPQIVAVLLSPSDRIAEYGLSETYAKFVAETVVPAVDALLQIVPNQKNRLIMGASLGGLAAIFTATQYPGIFENAAGQSPSFWFNEKRPNKKTISTFLEEYAQNNSIDHRLKLYFDVGYFETPTMIRTAKETLSQAHHLGIPVSFFMNPSQHNWTAWRNTTSRILLHFFRKK